MAKKSRKFEEVEEVDEIDEVDEDEDYDDEAPRRRGRGPWIALAVIIIVVILILGFYYMVISPPGVMGIYPGIPRETSDNSGLVFQADVALRGLGKAEGDGELKIKVEGETTYSGKITIKNGVARKELPYTNFVTKNGNYEFEISFEDKSASDDFDIDWVVEKTEIIITNMSRFQSEQLSKGENPSLNVTVNMQNEKERSLPETRHLDIDLDLYFEDESYPFRTESMVVENWKNFVDGTYKYTEAGNITAEITLKNLDVKPGSEFETMDFTVSNFINAAPIARGRLVDDDNIITLSAFGDNGMANFDASEAFDPDGSIVKYQWDFGDLTDDNVVITTEPQASHQYNAVGTYYVTLTVTDDVTPYPETDVYIEEYEKGKFRGRIKVEVKQFI